jgi:alpha-glucoside transport system substrate-binding protein
VAFLPQVGVLHQFVDKGWVKPLGAEAQAQIDKNFSTGWKDLGAYKDKQYGVYYKAANKSLIWYNAKVFENAGAKEPKTWQELLKTAQTIYDSGVTPFNIAAPTAGR